MLPIRRGPHRVRVQGRSRTSEFTTELLELLWTLEATVAGYPEQAKPLETILADDCYQAGDLPAVPEGMRTPPKLR